MEMRDEMRRDETTAPTEETPQPQSQSQVMRCASNQGLETLTPAQHKSVPQSRNKQSFLTHLSIYRSFP